MKSSTIKFLFIISALFVAPTLFAQNEKEEDPIEVAEKEVNRLKKDLELTESQVFYVDSIIASNYTLAKEAFDNLKKDGRTEYEIYKQTQQFWENKRLEALKKVLNEQQYIRYLKRIGKGKEYKKGKDGKYYLKSNKKK